MFSYSKLIVAVFGLFTAAYHQKFSTVYEWNDQFDGDYKSSAVDPRYIAVYKNKMILSLKSHFGSSYPSTLAWLRTDAPTKSPRLYSFPSLQKQDDRGKCITVQNAQGIEVDPFDQLWVVDNGGWFCPAKLLIINVADDNKLKHVHVFPDTVVSHFHGKRWLQEMVLDQSENDWFAYIGNSKHLVVFSLKEKKSWRVEATNTYIESLALSPLKMRQQLYLTEASSKNILSISVSDLRKGAKRVKPTIVAMKSAESNRMIMDEKGVLYYDLPAKKSIAMYDTNLPFKEKYIYKGEGSERIFWPFSFTMDASGNMWLIVQYKSNQNPRIRILKADVGARSYLYNHLLTVSKEGSFHSNQEKTSAWPAHPMFSEEILNTTLGLNPVEKGNGTCMMAKYPSLRVSNIVLSCWNVICVFSIAFQIYWFRKMKMSQDLIVEKEKKREDVSVISVDLSVSNEGEISEPIYEEIKPVAITVAAEIHQ